MAISEDPPNHPEPTPGSAAQVPPPAGNGSQGASNPLRWENILTAVAAAAGSAAWVSAVGSGVMGARLENAGMPVESVLALMPAEQRFAIGVSHLLAPLFVGLLGFLADLALTARMANRERPADGSPTPPPGPADGSPTPPPGPADGSPTPPPGPASKLLLRAQDRLSKLPGSTRRKLAAGTIASGALVGALLLEPPSLWLYMLQIGAIIVALIVVYIFSPGQCTAPSERGAVFLLVLVLAGVIAFAFERVWGNEFDFAAVSLKEPAASPLAGFYVTTTSGAVLLITLGEERDRAACLLQRDLGRIAAVPDDLIKQVWIGPGQVEFGLGTYCAEREIALREISP